MTVIWSKISGAILVRNWNVGHWAPKKRLTVLIALFLICAVIMAAAAVVIEARLQPDKDIALLQQQNRLLQETLWQEQSLQLAGELQRIYLGLLESVVIAKGVFEKESDVTHFFTALQNAALFNGWQHVQIGYSELQQAIALDVRATVSLLSLSSFWLTLQNSGNLFDIQQLEFKAANRPGSFTVQLQLLPLQAGGLPPATCEQHCLAPVATQQKQKGFLLRSRNNNEQLTPLTSDLQGRVSAARSEKAGASQ